MEDPKKTPATQDDVYKLLRIIEQVDARQELLIDILLRDKFTINMSQTRREYLLSKLNYE